MSGTEQDKGARDKIQNWLMAEGWNIAEQAHPDLAGLIRAEDAGGRRILIGQNKARPDLIHLEARVNVAMSIAASSKACRPRKGGRSYGSFDSAS